MKNRIIVSIIFLFSLIGLVVFMNFNRTVDAAYLGSGLPDANQNETLRYYDSNWVSSSALLNDGTDLIANGNITADAFIYSSDRTLKYNIKTLDNALDKVLALEGVSFNWKENDNSEIGLIAQNVENVLPELVVTNSDGLKAVKYGNMVALLIEAVKEQQAEIDLLKAEINSLK